MILLCPYCGIKIRRPFRDGISSCDRCQRIFDGSSYHKILSAFWMHRNWHVNLDVIQHHCELDEAESATIAKHIDQEYSFDQFLAIVKQIDYNLCTV
jgi:hypothetical protein